MACINSRRMVFMVCLGLLCFSGALQAKTVLGKTSAEWDSSMGIPQVVVKCIYSAQGGATVTLSDTSEMDGAFRIDAIPSQITSVRIRAAGTGYAVIDTTIALTGDSAYVLLSMHPSIFGEATKVVRGRFVVAGTTTGLARVPFRFYSAGLGSPITFWDTTKSDGTFLIDSIQNGCNLGMIQTEQDAACKVDTTFPIESDTTTVTIIGKATAIRFPLLWGPFIDKNGQFRSHGISLTWPMRATDHHIISVYSASGRRMVPPPISRTNPGADLVQRGIQGIFIYTMQSDGTR